MPVNVAGSCRLSRRKLLARVKNTPGMNRGGSVSYAIRKNRRIASCTLSPAPLMKMNESLIPRHEARYIHAKHSPEHQGKGGLLVQTIHTRVVPIPTHPCHSKWDFKHHLEDDMFSLQISLPRAVVAWGVLLYFFRSLLHPNRPHLSPTFIRPSSLDKQKQWG